MKNLILVIDRGTMAAQLLCNVLNAQCKSPVDFSPVMASMMDDEKYLEIVRKDNGPIIGAIILAECSSDEWWTEESAKALKDALDTNFGTKLIKVIMADDYQHETDDWEQTTVLDDCTKMREYFGKNDFQVLLQKSRELWPEIDGQGPARKPVGFSSGYDPKHPDATIFGEVTALGIPKE